MRNIIIPTKATAPAAPPIIAARGTDIWYGNHSSYEVIYDWDAKYCTLNLKQKEIHQVMNLIYGVKGKRNSNLHIKNKRQSI